MSRINVDAGGDELHLPIGIILRIGRCGAQRNRLQLTLLSLSNRAAR
ncbi:MAG: hypothetical protein WCA27_01110 [Candidatus Sulfotelmatobacter sp.]